MMNVESRKVDCVFCFPDGTQHQATAHLFEHEYSRRVFWYGVAQFGEVLQQLPEGLNSGRVTFEDGRLGGVSFLDGKILSGGYMEVGFVGVSTLTAG
jgi:hypothetical protein